MSEPKLVLVTGGAGYIGSRLVPRLLAAGHRVRVLDALFFANGLERLGRHTELDVIKGDIRDRSAIERSLRDVTTVIHLAAVANDPSFNADPALGRSINIDCLPHFMASAKRLGCRRFIYASTASVYGINDALVVDENQPCAPITDYSRYKAEGEKHLFDLTSQSFETIAVRAATACGGSPRQRLDLTVNLLTASALARGEIAVFGGSQYRPNVHVADLGRFYTSLVSHDSLGALCGCAVNLGGENYTVAEIATQVKAIVDRYFATTIPITTTESDDIRSYRLDSRLARQAFGFQFAYTLRDAVLELCDRWQSGCFADSANIMRDPRFHNLLNMRVADWSFASSTGRTC
jgi:nucleoside-diphosphate-sugar epimerase